MGFYLRKSLRVGPLRFNLSKSGVGVSAGVRGLRLGSGPRGNYVHMGRYGVYYRATLPSGSPRTHQPAATPFSSEPTPFEPAADRESLTEIESGEVTAMRDSSSAALLDELNSKRKKKRLLPGLGIAGALFLALMVGTNSPAWLTGAVLLVAIAAVVFAYFYDQMSKTAVLLYEIESESQKDYQFLHDAFDQLRSCCGAWHIEAQGDTKDRKRHAGATSLVRKSAISLSKNPPKFVKTNVEVPAIPAGRQVLHFFPDRLLVFEPNGVGAVNYNDLLVERQQTRFIEEGQVPGDARVVDRTWRYVNKKGGPDRRFKDNRELPITLYEDIHLRSHTGLNELIQFSKLGVGEAFESAIHKLRRQVEKH